MAKPESAKSPGRKIIRMCQEVVQQWDLTCESPGTRLLMTDPKERAAADERRRTVEKFRALLRELGEPEHPPKRRRRS